jgi:predicted GTPase
MARTRVVIMGAAGRDFHNFNVLYRKDRSHEVVAFTATQIPYVEERRYPASLAGSLYPRGIPIHPESELPRLIDRLQVDEVVFS